MRLRSYAKINLCLDVLGKRKDGYHDVETIFQQIELYDELILEPADSIRLKCNIKELENEDNLAFKTAKLLKEHHHVKNGVSIQLKKNIPVGSGLSGGSSNAAAVMKGLNIMWKLGLSQKELMRQGKELSMDLPFHIVGGTCLGTGRNDIIEKLKDLPKYHVVLVHPGFGVSTKDAYSGLELNAVGKKRSSRKFMESYDLDLMHNDFEATVFKKHPELAQIKQKLGGHALMSGSGSCVFGLFDNEQEAEAVAESLKKQYENVFITETINKRIDCAEVMGFCFGVKRAMDEIDKLRGKEDVFVLGKLIHNPQVIKGLEKDGIRVVDDYTGLKGTIVVSAHGVSDNVREDITRSGLKLIDLTCPLVKKVHDITKKEENKGRKIIVFGDRDHAEVKGIVGNLKDYAIVDGKELSDVSGKVSVVSQTTREVEDFKEVGDKIKKLNPEAEIIDTICSSTKDRQRYAIELAKSSDLMIVVGGMISSNTKRLKEVCEKYCDTKHVETADEMQPEWFFGKEKVGITAGASTPQWIVDEVIDALKMLI
ncbi:MAG: 4-hydroxy-3-methylbut-2-enyl diphosphate reductase [Nanoarchaeota archaeon]|nr:4-hydroxy-3-methylbut-2-enyl diphosphate reductase [Nanoarchaeota archaeon]